MCQFLRSLLGMAVLAGVAAAVPNDMMSAIPLHFEPNLGQTDARVRFSARGAGMSVYLTEAETVFARKSSEPVRMKLRGGRAAKFEPLERLPGVSNYYRGNDPKKWREGVPHYARVRAKSVYDGVDLVYYGNGRRLEYDFIVAPYADPSKIELAYEGTESMRVDKDGTLVLVTASGELRQRKPLVYQEAEGKRVEVAASYRIEGQAVRFELARYDAEKPLVIDPILEYGTFLGGDFEDHAKAVSADTTGVWVAGYTGSPNFPLASPADSTSANYEGFVTKLNAAGTGLVFSTFLGGSDYDFLNSMSVDAAGNSFVTGSTASSDFPVLAAYQTTYGGAEDAMLARLNATGALTFATFLGGASRDTCAAVVVTANGISLACNTSSQNFLGGTNAGPYGPVLARLSLNGANLLFNKTLAGAALFQALAADASGAVYITGNTRDGVSLPTTQGAFQPARAQREDAFVAKLNPAGDQWVFITHLGGSGYETGNAIGVDALGQVWVAGTTGSSDFPTRNAYQSSLGGPPQSCCLSDAFLTVFNPSGTALVFSTFLGGSGEDSARALALPADGVGVIGGSANPSGFPIAAGWKSAAGSLNEMFFAAFSSSGALLYSSYFGPTYYTKLNALAPGPAGTVYLAGSTFWPTNDTSGTVTQGAFDTTLNNEDAFVARFIGGPPPVQITVTSNPIGRQVIVDGRSVNTPAVFSWQPGTAHALEAIAQTDGQTYFSFSNWAHGGPARSSITTPAAAATYVANYAAEPCVQSFNPSAVTVGFEPRSGFVPLTTQSPCKWTPISSAPWLTVDPLEMTGSRTLVFRTSPNPGRPRTATITAGSATLTVNQAGGMAGFAAPVFAAPLSGQEVRTKGITFGWSPVTAASGYELKIQEFSSLVFTGGQAGTNATRTTIDMPDGSYTAYVRACGAGGFGDANCGDYASLRFTVHLLAPVQTPVILTPVPNQTLRSSTNLISWQALPGATSYEVTLVNQTTGQTDLFINTATLSTIFTMKSSAQYLLTVRGCQFKCGPASVLSFSVQLPALSQTPPTGLTAQIANGNTLNLSWNAVTGADLYRIQVVQSGAGPGGGALTVAARQVSATNFSMPVPAGAATVVLNACNGDGCGPASTVAINPADPNPSTPVVASPMPVVVANGPNITISWSRIPGDNGSNTDYRLYVGDLSRDGPALDVMTKNNFYGAFLRAEGRRYDALVFATQSGTTVTGPASGFMVAGSSATASLITSPTHNSTFRQGPFRLAWAPIPDAVRYQYYVAREGRQSPDLTGMTPGLFIDTSLSVTANTTYNAIVRACPSNSASVCSPDSDAGWGPWSNTVTGTTRFTVAP